MTKSFYLTHILLILLLLNEMKSVGAWFFDTPDNTRLRSTKTSANQPEVSMQKKSWVGMLLTNGETHLSGENHPKSLRVLNDKRQEEIPIPSSLQDTLDGVVLIENRKQLNKKDSQRLRQLRHELFKQIQKLQRQLGIES